MKLYGSGYGWWLWQDGIQGHGGAVPGFYAQMLYKDEDDGAHGLVMMMNTGCSLVPYLEIVTQGKTLKIGLISEYEYKFENATQRVEVTIPELARLESTNKSSVSIQDFNTLGEIKIQVSDFSSLAGNLQADSIQVDINGHSSVNISGMAQEVTGNIAGQSTINLSTLDCQSITIVADQHSQVKE